MRSLPADRCPVFFVLIAELIVIVTASKYIGIAIPFCIIAVFVVQKFYLRTSRQLRILDIESKSHLFTHFLDLLNGLPTIRAFGWEQRHLERALDALNTSQKPFYLLFSVQRWLNLVLDMIVGIIAIILVTIAIQTREKVDPAMIGLALVNLVGFSQMLKQLITNWTLLETSAGAVSRIRCFTATVEPENTPYECQQPPANWPSQGEIIFADACASYRYVLVVSNL